jgi:DNA-binding IclR family transcriptional regulator
MQNLASLSDVKILLACADQDRWSILVRLYQESATQKQLIAELGLNSGTASRHMKTLEDAELVVRDRSHGPYTLSVRDEIWQLLRMTINITSAITTRRMREIEERGQELQRAAMRPAEESARSEGG